MNLTNIIKAHIVKNNPETNKENKLRFPKLLKDHNLVNLCKTAQLVIGSEESSLLQDITEFVLWEGRYPIPINHIYNTPRKKEDGIWRYSGDIISNYGQQVEVNRLFNRFLSILEGE